MTGYRTRWVRQPEQDEDPERLAIREALAFGKAVYDQRRALGFSVADLAGRADMTVDESGLRDTLAWSRGRVQQIEDGLPDAEADVAEGGAGQ
jgi:hypothetical protein